jgi:hypothetical protein
MFSYGAGGVPQQPLPRRPKLARLANIAKFLRCKSNEPSPLYVGHPCHLQHASQLTYSESYCPSQRYATVSGHRETRRGGLALDLSFAQAGQTTLFAREAAPGACREAAGHSCTQMMFGSLLHFPTRNPMASAFPPFSRTPLPYSKHTMSGGCRIWHLYLCWQVRAGISVAKGQTTK